MPIICLTHGGRVDYAKGSCILQRTKRKAFKLILTIRFRIFGILLPTPFHGLYNSSVWEFGQWIIPAVYENLNINFFIVDS